MFHTTFSSNVSVVTFLPSISSYFFHLWSFPTISIYWPRGKLVRNPKLGIKTSNSKPNLASSLLCPALGFAFCTNEGLRGDWPRVLCCSTTTLYQGKLCQKILLLSRVLRPNLSTTESVLSLFWAKNKQRNHRSQQSEKSIPENIADHSFALLLERQQLGKKTEECKYSIRRLEFTSSLIIALTRSRDLDGLIFLLSKYRNSAFPGLCQSHFWKIPKEDVFKIVCSPEVLTWQSHPTRSLFHRII